MVEPGLFEFFLPQPRRRDPNAWLVANAERAAGEVPPGESRVSEFSLPTSEAERGFSSAAPAPTPTPGPGAGRTAEISDVPGQGWPNNLFGGDPKPRMPTNTMPSMPKTGGGTWASWIENPGAAAFLTSMGMQLMAGGNFGSAISNGVMAQNLTAREGYAEEEARRNAAMGYGPRGGRRRGRRAAAEYVGPAAGGEDGAFSVRGRPAQTGERGLRRRGRPRDGFMGEGGSSAGPTRGPMEPVGAAPEAAPGAEEENLGWGDIFGSRGESGPSRVARGLQNRNLAQVAGFLQQARSEEEWAQANRPGGIVHAVFGGPQDQSQQRQLLQFVQSRASRGVADLAETEGGSRMRPSGARGDARGTPSGEELIEMLGSRNPAIRAEGESWATRLYRAPARGFRWGLNEDGFVDQIPTSGSPRSRARTSEFSQAASGGVDAARLNISNIREHLTQGYVTPHDITGATGIAQRWIQQQTGVGDWPALLNTLKDGVMSYVHSRSGASVAVREFEHYLTTRMPVLGDSERRIQYKLADLELALMLIARRRGDDVPMEDILAMHNRARSFSGFNRPVTMEELQRILPALEHERAVVPGRTSVPGMTLTPTPPRRRPTMEDTRGGRVPDYVAPNGDRVREIR